VQSDCYIRPAFSSNRYRNIEILLVITICPSYLNGYFKKTSYKKEIRSSSGKNCPRYFKNWDNWCSCVCASSSLLWYICSYVQHKFFLLQINMKAKGNRWDWEVGEQSMLKITVRVLNLICNFVNFKTFFLIFVSVSPNVGPKFIDFIRHIKKYLQITAKHK
jgi:hypothetical protein